MAMEFLEEVPELDAMFMSICGGGLSAGCCLCVKEQIPSCKSEWIISHVLSKFNLQKQTN